MNVSYLNGLLGGALIGVAAVLLFWFNGRIMGISGIASRLLAKPDNDFGWRIAFVVGLVLGGFLYQLKHPIEVSINASWGVVIVAGLLDRKSTRLNSSH